MTKRHTAELAISEVLDALGRGTLRWDYISREKRGWRAQPIPLEAAE